MSSADTINPNETTATRRKRGEEIVRTLSGGRLPAELEALDRDFPFLANAVTAYAIGELFARDVLDVRTRQLALVAAFAALGLGEFMKIHAGYAMNHVPVPTAGPDRVAPQLTVGSRRRRDADAHHLP